MANILVIEDDDQLRRAYQRMLRIAGPHNVVLVASGEDAIEAIQKNPLFDAVLSDYNIGGQVNGGDVFSWVEFKLPKLAKKYIFICDSDEAKALCARANIPYLQKPTDNDTILKTLGELLTVLPKVVG